MVGGGNCCVGSGRGGGGEEVERGEVLDGGGGWCVYPASPRIWQLPELATPA